MITNARQNTIIVLEDSSKAVFGGGQRGTLAFISSIKSLFQVVLFDYTPDSLFVKRATPHADIVGLLRGPGSMVGAEKSSFSLGLSEILCYPIYLVLNLAHMLWFMRRRRLSKNNTIVYAATKKGVVLGYLLKKLLGTTYVYHAHTIDDPSNILFKLMARPVRNCDLIICVSDSVKRNIRLPQCVTVYNPITIRSGIPPKNLHPDKPVVVAAFANLIRWKGIHVFMESHKHLAEPRRVVYWIFGDGPEKASLRQLENDNVVLKGFASNVDALLEKEIAIVAVPSIHWEACPSVPLEAFGHGIPVITTNIGGQAEIVKHNEVGYQVAPNDPAAIAGKIDYLIAHPEVYAALSQNALTYARQFDRAIFVEKMLASIVGLAKTNLSQRGV